MAIMLTQNFNEGFAAFGPAMRRRRSAAGRAARPPAPVIGASPVVEKLEERRLLTATYTLSDGLLRVNGDDTGSSGSADVIVLSVSGSNIVGTDSGTQFVSVLTTSVSNIEVNGKGDNDSITID